jgi:hypothetical protein
MSSRVHQCGFLLGLALAVLTGCKVNEQPDLHGIVGSGPDRDYTGGPECATPDDGCPCDEVGELVDCGTTELRSGDYVSCSMGERECTIDHVWGACVYDHQTSELMPRSGIHTLAVTGPVKCTTNPCDPFCQTTSDDGQDPDNLPSGICEAPGGGIVACGQSCGYSGPHGGSYSSLGASWRKLPTSCTAATSAGEVCGYDRDCNGTSCADWTFPCYDPAPTGCALAKKIDLELGPPCKSLTTYHFQVCNRGSDRANAGTVKIGVFSSNTVLQTALPSAAPDKGYVTFTLGTAAGSYIDPGKCLDVNPSNSTASISPALDLTATRAIAVNYDKSITGGECNYANNWQVFEPANACTGCTGYECSQTCASAHLTGTIYDPAGVNVVPGVIVYVPQTSTSLQALTDGVQCDTCASLYTGTPIASAVTDADGKFVLTNVPVGVTFKVVIQIGRWRRVVDQPAIVGTCGSGTPAAALAPGENSRLPSKASEGNIPKIAISMSAGDHLQCLLRKIGIEESEFTNKNGAGRVHLYAYNGMKFNGTGTPSVTGVSCTGSPAGTCATDLWSSPTQLDTYSAVIAPCDKNPFGGTPGSPNPYVGSAGSPLGYAAAPYVPSTYANFGRAQDATNELNTTLPPFLTDPDSAVSALDNSPSPTQATNLKNFIDKGGRLFSTHWMAYFLTRSTYPASVNYVFGSYVDNDRQGSSPTGTSFPYKLDTTNPLGLAFADWADGVGASPAGYGTATFSNWRHLVKDVNAPTVRLAYGDSTASPVNHPSSCNSTYASSTSTSASPSSCASQGGGQGGPMIAAYQFDTPWGVPAANQCGRVVVAETHVSKSNSTSSQQGTFLPWSSTTCDTAAMNGEEKAFEFLLFNATQCVGLVTPPAPATPLSPATHTVDYDSACPLGTQPQWLYFYWQATAPGSTSIVFNAQTADTQAELGAATAASAGSIVGPASTTGWTSDTQTVATRLAALTPAQVSRRWLRISMTINPTGTTSPTLLQWKQDFDCKPAE